VAIVIRTEKQLRAIGRAIGSPANGNYCLARDIGLSGVWRPLAVDSGFTLDGRGYRIYGLEAPLFKELSNARVHNLRLAGAVEGGGEACGLLVREAINSIIENVSTEGRLTSSSGLCGSAANVRFSGCLSGAYIDAGSCDVAGGIVGTATGCRFSECINNGEVYAHVESDAAVGGIAGCATTSVFSGCGNYAALSGGRCAGGIAGIIGASMLGNCVQRAQVFSRKAAGGLCGIMGTCIFGMSRIASCAAYGPVEARDRVAGGICGAMQLLSGSVENCHAFCTAVSAPEGVARIVGDIALKVGSSLRANLAYAGCLLRGCAPGGEVYYNQPVCPDDKGYGLAKAQGANSR